MKQTLIYKTAGSCQIHADIYGPSDDIIRPVIAWFHGGALINGDRSRIAEEQLSFYLEAGYRVVSCDYRLAPETKLPAIIEDLVDAIRWIREMSTTLRIDPERLAVMGHSAGGYLTLMAGHAIRPRPKALVSFYGYGDILGDWYTQPSPFYCQQPLVSREEAYACVGTEPVSTSLGQPNRFRFYLYCRQQGLWPNLVSGMDPITQASALQDYCPLYRVTEDYPPTLLLHGDADTDVPYEQSVLMAAELARHGVQHEFVTVAGGSHGFDGRGLNDAEVGRIFHQVRSFLARHISV